MQIARSLGASYLVLYGVTTYGPTPRDCWKPSTTSLERRCTGFSARRDPDADLAPGQNAAR